MPLEDVASAEAEFHLLELGVEVTHLPRGGSEVRIRAIPVIDHGRLPVDLQAGREVVRHMQLQVPSGLIVTKDDVWTVYGERWQTDSLGTQEAGLKTVNLIRRDDGIRTGPRTIL